MTACPRILALVAATLAFLGGDGCLWAIDFKASIAPILEAKCLSCHNDNTRKADLSFSSPGDLRADDGLVSAENGESLLWAVVTPKGDEGPSMPKKGEPLTKEERVVWREWIEQGAPWPAGLTLKERSLVDDSWWSLRPIRHPSVPSTASLEFEPEATHPVDHFVYRSLARQQLSPSKPASRRALIRRLSYDLRGLAPSDEEVEAFEANDDPLAYHQLVDRYLASPSYGERWGRHWLDVVRFGESRGFERNEIIRNLWPFRDYVIDSFNWDKPYDQLVREHLAGDVLSEDEPEVELGSAFLVAGPYDDVGNQDAKQAAQIRANTIDEIIRATSEAFLGVTLGCARCHDHKFDPLLQKDYYAWYATFAGVRHGTRTLATKLERAQFENARKPLVERQSAYDRERSEIEKVIASRFPALLPEAESEWIRAPIERQLTEERFSPIEAKGIRLSVLGAEHNPKARSGYRIDELEVWSDLDPDRNVALLSEGSKAFGSSRQAEDFDGAYSPNLCIDGRFGERFIATGPELTIEFGQLESISRITFSSDRTGDAIGQGIAGFVCEYRFDYLTESGEWKPLVDSFDRKPINENHQRHRLYQRAIQPAQRQALSQLAEKSAEVRRALNAVKPLRSIWLGQHDKIEGQAFHVFRGGSPERPGEEVYPTSLSTLSESNGYQLDRTASNGQRRLAMADWIVQKENPLTARVIVNRVWHYHFGRGLVATPSDFGAMGIPPSHPELLDWLASEFMDHGWSLKHVHRLILTSATYQQSSEWRANAAAVDGNNQWLWRFAPRRLSAEELRDSMLQVAGVLRRQMGGVGFKLYRYLQDNVATYIPLDEHGSETYRRAVYHHNARAATPDLLSEFDCPDSAFGAPKRASTTTPLQAMSLMNHAFTIDMAEAWASRLETMYPDDVTRRVRQAYREIYQREPSSGERQEGILFWSAVGGRAFCRALLNSNEFLYLN